MINFQISSTTKARDKGITSDKITYLGIGDYNCPGAKVKSNNLDIASILSTINNINPAKNASLVTLPDFARDSLAKGLIDEEKQISDNLWANNQNSDTRWVELYEAPKGLSARETRKKFGTGRIVTNKDHKDNPWLLNSELAVSGRPLGSDGCEVFTLPRGSEILQPSDSSASEVVHTAERARPSLEQISAQKGSARWEKLILSMLKGMTFDGPLLIVTPTGYVEDLGTAVHHTTVLYYYYWYPPLLLLLLLLLLLVLRSDTPAVHVFLGVHDAPCLR